MDNKLGIKITITFITFILVSDCVVIPLAASIFGQFPDASPVLQNFLLTGAMLVSIPAGLIGGWLTQYISKKSLLIFACALYMISGAGGALINSMSYMVAMRFLVGVSIGFIGIITNGVIAEVCPDEKERSGMIGIYFGVMSALGILLGIISGYIGVIDWHHSFLINLAVVPILILVVLFVPKTPPEGKKVNVASGEKEGIPVVKLGGLCIAFLMYCILYMALWYFISIYVAEEGLGDASVAGIFSSLVSVGAFLGSIMFALIYARTKRFTPLIFFLVLAGSCLVLSITSNLYTAGIMIVIAGWTFGICIAYYFLRASLIVSCGLVPLTTAWVAAMQGSGIALAPYGLQLYQQVFNLQTMKPTFFYFAITLGICALISVILAVWERNGKNGSWFINAF